MRKGLNLVATALPALFPTTAALWAQGQQPGRTEAPARLEVGATVTGSDGVPIGKIERVGGRSVTVKLGWGRVIEPSPASLRAGPNGFAMELTAEQLKARTGG